MWVWNLAALMLRSRKSWLRMVPMAVALLIMTVSLGVNRSINLSPEQSVTSTLGAADGLVSPGFSVLAGSSSPTVPINRWKVRQINPYLETQVSVKGLPEEVLYQESSMPGINTKGRYALISGKWPTKPSEIVVTPSLRQGIGGKNKLVLEPGNYDLTIVGTVGATFDKSSREILARSGTWQAWPLTQKQAKISGLSGNYLIFFTSPDSAGTCSKVNDDLGSDPLDSDACTTREQLLSKEFAPLSGKKIVEQYLAWFLVAGLGAGLAAAAATTSARRIIAPLTAMGVPRRKLALSLRVVTLFMSMATAAASLVTGELLVIAIRPLLARFSDNPLSPVSSPTMSAVTCPGCRHRDRRRHGYPEQSAGTQGSWQTHQCENGSSVGMEWRYRGLRPLGMGFSGSESLADFGGHRFRALVVGGRTGDTVVTSFGLRTRRFTGPQARRVSCPSLSGFMARTVRRAHGRACCRYCDRSAYCRLTVRTDECH